MAEAAFGVQLRRSRQAAALSLRQLATKVGYDHSYLSQVERGQRPGSAHLAELCDRELGTGALLTTAYERTRPPLQPAVHAASAAEPLRSPESSAALPGTVDLLEASRHSLAVSLGRVQDVDEWAAVTTSYARDVVTTPPAALLPDLAADLELLRATASRATASDGTAALTAPAAELAVLIALTLTALGRTRAAGRWWRTARATADSSAERWVGSFARGWEVTSGLSEHRPLPELLKLAEEALTLADDPLVPVDDALVLAGRRGCAARALAARAEVLASAGRVADALTSLREFLAVACDLPRESSGGTSLHDWPEYRVCGVESFVHTRLGDTRAAYVAQDRTLACCPTESLHERAEIELQLAQCLVVDGESAAGLAVAMRVLVELPDEWHTHYLYDAAGRVLSAVPGKDLGRAAVRDYRELLTRRPYQRRDSRSVGCGSSLTGSRG